MKQELRRKSLPSYSAVGKAPGRPPASLAALAATIMAMNSTRFTVARGYCSPPAAASPSTLSLSILAAT